MIHSIHNVLLGNISLGQIQNNSYCEDNYVGTINFNGKNFIGYNNGNTFGLLRNARCSHSISQNRATINYAAFSPQGGNRKIVILLESPHLSEFNPTFTNSVNTGPALGSSGDRFNNQCIAVFNNNLSALQSALGLPSAELFDVYFVNAIQYQCSLGMSPIKPTIRDFVFEALWNKQPDSYRDDLIDRLNIIQPNLIINACTRKLQNTCCNRNNITSGLSGFKNSFLTATSHVSAWNKNTVIN